MPLFTEGSPAQEIYFIERGLVKLATSNEGGRDLIVGLRRSGCFLGSESAVLQRPHPVSAITLTSCILCRIPIRTFLRIVDEDHEFAKYLRREQSCELHDQVGHIVGLGSSSARLRLERLLAELMGTVDIRSVRSEVRLPPVLKQREIAELIAVTPQHLSRILREMERDGSLRRERGRLIVCESERTDGIADSRKGPKE
jgi:CRP-like cAMP-binding protein